MVNNKWIFNLILVASFNTFAINAEARNYSPTPGVTNLTQWANDLRGIAFTDPQFNSYCSRYTAIALQQVQRRDREGCQYQIPYSSRWASDYYDHYNWCSSVSSGASSAEVLSREGALKSCINQQDNYSSGNSLKTQCVQNDRMHNAAARGDYSYVMRCLDAGVSANIREGNNWTPLHSASRFGHYSVVQLLLTRGAGINLRDNTGRTALDQAQINNHYDVAELLRSYGGNSRD
jgi:hypothetical protein